MGKLINYIKWLFQKKHVDSKDLVIQLQKLNPWVKLDIDHVSQLVNDLLTDSIKRAHSKAGITMKHPIIGRQIIHRQITYGEYSQTINVEIGALVKQKNINATESEIFDVAEKVQIQILKIIKDSEYLAAK